MVNNLVDLHKSVIEAWGAPEIARVYMTAKTDNIALKSSSNSILQLLGLFLVFIAILAAAFYVSKWIGKTGMGVNQNRNMEIIETCRLSQNQCLQIVRIADKYVALSVGKEKVEMIVELDKESINFEKKQMDGIEFKDIFEKIKNNEVLGKIKKNVVKVDENEKKQD